METFLIQKLGEIMGFPKTEIDGCFCPGGTLSNITSFLVARDWKFPHVKVDGWKKGDNPVCIASN
jgi:glutamate/tyrosine decarboxylase-like PLP-dependent enzyme